MTKRIAVFLPNWIGDVVMATPTLRTLHRHFGDHELIGVMKPYVGDVLEGTHWLSSRLVYDRRPGAGVLSSWQLIGRLRELQIDKAVLLTNSLRTAMIAWLGGSKERVGYARELRSWLLTHKLYPPREGRHWRPISAVDYYLELAYLMGCPSESRRLELPITALNEDAAEVAWERLDLPVDRRVIAFHIAGGWGGAATAKAWPLEHFVTLARRLVARYDHEVLVLCGPSERKAAAELVRRASHPRIKGLAEIERLSLGLLKGALNRSSLLVTTDSGPRHLATALDLPVVALFGATDPAWTETYHPRAITLLNKLDCGPCQQKHCPLMHHRCMRELSVERVFAAVEQQLAAEQQLKAERIVAA
jgi:heptosyltransferase II